jgi:phosphate starvation-inducible PhoH-like protein
LKGRNNTPVTKKVKSDENRDTSPLKPLNDKQKDYISAINAESIVICTGVWGSAKTYIPAVMACDMLLAKKIEKIVVARPTEGKGKSLGYMKGDKNTKLEGWCAPVLEVFKKRLGIGNLEAYIENGRIELLALEQVKGRSWDDTFILIDEVEDMESCVAKSLVGRQGINSKLVLTGDIAQQDLKNYSGLQMLLDVADYAALDIAMIDFDDWEYCVRSDEAKMWGQAFEAYEKEHGRVK